MATQEEARAIQQTAQQQVTAGQAGRYQFLASQSAALLNQARAYRVALTIAAMSGEVPPETLGQLFQEFMACAALCQPGGGQ